MKDYRDSHKDPAKGADYHAKFSACPHRSMLWNMEKLVLDDVTSNLFAENRFRHLDFACGTGRILEHLQDRAESSVGVDISESMLQVARGRLTGCEILNFDITRDDLLGRRQFDLITAFRFFPNAQDELRRDALCALVEHLSPGGYVVFNNHKNRSSLSYTVGRLLTRRPLGEMSEKEVLGLASAAGLRLVRSYHMGVIPSTDKYRVLPMAVLQLAERFLSAVRFLRPLASNVIYVFAKE